MSGRFGIINTKIENANQMPQTKEKSAEIQKDNYEMLRRWQWIFNVYTVNVKNTTNLTLYYIRRQHLHWNKDGCLQCLRKQAKKSYLNSLENLTVEECCSIMMKNQGKIVVFLGRSRFVK